MITWMQRHKKWLIITIWISTIAFIGAGFVGWGQYSYGDKAGSVAKVGNIEISQGELQKTYSRLYSKYNKMFKGNFDEAKAKKFGLQKQALQQLIQQAYIINFAKSYDLEVTDKELIANLKTQKFFFKDGAFDKETYKQVLSQSRLSTKEYEKELRKDLLIQKMMKLLPIKISKNETAILNAIYDISDKINYKVLSPNDIKIDISDKKLKTFWKERSNNFMTDISYDINFIIQKQVKLDYKKAKITEYYNNNQTHFKDKDAKLLTLKSAKNKIIEELNKKATKDKALRTYIAYKKNKLSKDIIPKTATISKSNNQFNREVLNKVTKLSLTSPYTKPILINGIYYIFKLTKIHPSTQKTYKEAKAETLVMYEIQTKKEKLQQLANSSLDTFNGKTTKFITMNDFKTLTLLNQKDSIEFLQKLFTSDKKRSQIVLNDGKIILYYILEQKLLDNSKIDLSNSLKKLKDGMFGEALMKHLRSKYKLKIFIQGL